MGAQFKIEFSTELERIFFHRRIWLFLETNKKQNKNSNPIPRGGTNQTIGRGQKQRSAGEYRRTNHDSRWLPHTVTFFFLCTAHAHTAEEEEEEHAVVFQLIYTDTHTPNKRAREYKGQAIEKQETSEREIRSELSSSSSSSDIIFSLSLYQPTTQRKREKEKIYIHKHGKDIWIESGAPGIIISI